MAAFVAILLLSNVIGAGKVATIDLPGIGAWPFGAGILFFPLSYVIGDVLTEVYGYARARRCIWAGFAALAVHGVHELGGGGAAARRELGRAGGVRSGVRPGAADRLRLDHRLLGGRVRQQLRPRQDEDLDRGQASVDPDDRLDRASARASTA